MNMYQNKQGPPQPQVGPGQKKEAILDFINNPTQDEQKLNQIIDYVKDLTKMKYDMNLEYVSQQYCAYSGQQITNDNFVIIDGYTFSQQPISQYFMRDGHLDVSIGDIEFQNFQDGESKHITVPLTQQVLEQIYGVNLETSLKEADRHYSKRLNDPVTFICKKTQKEHLISDRIKINGEDVSIYWAIQNVNQLQEPVKSYVESCKNNYPTVTQISQSQRIDNVNSSQNIGQQFEDIH